MPDDPIQPEVVMGQIVLTLLRGPNGQPGNLNVQSNMDELLGRFTMDKAKAIMEDHWRVQNAPRVIPVNGTTKMSEDLRRKLGG